MIGRRVAAVWLCTVAALATVLIARGVTVTTAYFTDSHPGSIGGVNGTSTPNLSATVRVEPQKINLKEKGDGELKAFIDKLPAPHALSEIDLSSITLCYAGACIPSDGAAKLDGKAHVAAEFDRAALAGLVGTARGDLTLVVQGKLIAGGTFSGKDTNRVTGGSDATSGTTVGVVPNALPAATPTPTPTPDVIATPTPTPDVIATPTPTPDVIATPTPTPDVIATPTPTPDVIATPTPTPDVIATPTPTPDVIATPTPTPDVIATPTPTPDVIATPTPTPDVIATPTPTPDVIATPTP